MRRITIPRAHPLVQTLFAGMNEVGATYEDVADVAGLGPHSLVNWRVGHTPLVTNLEAALNAVGYELVAVKKNENIL